MDEMTSLASEGSEMVSKKVIPHIDPVIRKAIVMRIVAPNAIQSDLFSDNPYNKFIFSLLVWVVSISLKQINNNFPMRALVF